MNEEITLITNAPTTDDDGFSVTSEKTNTKYANVKSAKYYDVYSSMSTNKKASIVFEMRREDFDETRVTINKKHYYPTKIEYDGAIYDVIRWFFNNEGKAEFVCG